MHDEDLVLRLGEVDLLAGAVVDRELGRRREELQRSRGRVRRLERLDPDGPGRRRRDREDQREQRAGLHARRHPEGRAIPRGESGWRSPRRAAAGRPAGFLDRALGAPAEARGRHADVEDADPAERVVEPHRIGRVEAGERVRDLARGLPVGGGSPRQSESSRDPMDVRVRRDDEAARRDAAPQPEVEVVAPDHPAQVEVPALARRARGRVRKEEAHGGALGQRAGRRGPAGSRRPRCARRRARAGPRCPDPRPAAALSKKRAQRTPPASRARAIAKRSAAASRGAVEAVAESGQGVAREAPEVADAVQGPGGPGTERRQQPPDVGLDDGHLAVGERRRDPTHDLSILGDRNSGRRRRSGPCPRSPARSADTGVESLAEESVHSP